MYLSNRDIKWAIESGKLIVSPPPENYGGGYDETSIDLHLDSIDRAKVWNRDAVRSQMAMLGVPDGQPVLHLGSFEWANFADQFLIQVPEPQAGATLPLVYRRDQAIYVRKGGFLLWTTEEEVGTPPANPELISFVNAKSTKARTGLLVHFTAPTIHAGWKGKITLEIANLGPFTFVLRPKDAIAQLTVATISSKPDLTLLKKKSVTAGQVDPSGRAAT